MHKKTHFNSIIKQYKANNKIIAIFHLCSINQLQFIEPVLQLIDKEFSEIKYFIATTHPYELSYFKTYIKNQNEYIIGDIVEELLNVDLFLQTEIYGRGPKNSHRIFIGHGQPNKWTYWSKENLEAFEHYFLYGPLEKEMFTYIMSQNIEKTKHIKLYEVGYPKLDDQLNNNYCKNEIYKKYKLNPENKTIIYSPAWDPGGSLRENGLKIVENLLKLKNYNILVKLHPVSMEPNTSPDFEFYTGGKVWEDEFKVFENHDNFHFIKDSLINPILYISDYMLTDFSGVALEFMSMNKPVFYLDTPKFYEDTQSTWKNDALLSKKDDRFNAGRNYGYELKNIDTLAQDLIHLIELKDVLFDKRKAFINKFLYNHGMASKTTIMTMLKILENKDNNV